MVADLVKMILLKLNLIQMLMKLIWCSFLFFVKNHS